MAGPRLFLSCPMNTSESHSWFTDLWNYSIVPYLLEAVRDGVQVCLSVSLSVCLSLWLMVTNTHPHTPF